MAFALVLHLQLDDEKRHVLITSTLIIIMFTILCLGGSTLPLLKVCRVLDAGFALRLCFLLGLANTPVGWKYCTVGARLIYLCKYGIFYFTFLIYFCSC